MPEYGFVIDQRKCIGCHACTVACKAENEVPVGDFRTWVKYTERGSFPEARRHFTVLRCNHCDAAPCVEICPVVALHKRPDAIVDLDRDLCIGCRACMQACPYDALYLNKDTGTAEKCHYCAHRTEIGLEPACVIVCPEEAIVCGDVSDPASRIGTIVREETTSLRKPEKGTKPRVWYLDALAESLQPGKAREPDAWLWSDRRRPPRPVPGFETVPELVTTLNVDHEPEWGWHIWSYLLTKNVAAGAMILAPLLGALGVAGGWWPEATALVFLGITGFLLVHDLERPERFLKILLHPNPASWLVKGTWILLAFGAATTLSLLLQLLGETRLSQVVRWINLPAAVMTSGYTAFLFHQCRGRDLWLEKGVLARLVLRATLLGAGLTILAPLTGGTDWPAVLFATLAFADAAWSGLAMRHRPRGDDAARAHALFVQSGVPRWSIFALALAAISVLAGSTLFGQDGLDQIDSIHRYVGLSLAGIGLVLYEREWIRAGQEVPNS